MLFVLTVLEIFYDIFKKGRVMNNIVRNEKLLHSLNTEEATAVEVIDLLIASQVYCLKQIKDGSVSLTGKTVNGLFSTPRKSMVEQGDLKNILMDVQRVINGDKNVDFYKYSYLDWKEQLECNYKQEKRYVVTDLNLNMDMNMFDATLPNKALKTIGRKQALTMYAVLQYALTGVGN